MEIPSEPASTSPPCVRIAKLPPSATILAVVGNIVDLETEPPAVWISRARLRAKARNVPSWKLKSTAWKRT